MLTSYREDRREEVFNDPEGQQSIRKRKEERRVATIVSYVSQTNFPLGVTTSVRLTRANRSLERRAWRRKPVSVKVRASDSLDHVRAIVIEGTAR